MIRDSVGRYRARVREEFEASLAEDHTAHQVAASFAIGVFITALPTLGLGLGLFVVLLYFVRWMSKIALFGSVLVLNPAVKPAVYALSYWVGDLLVDPEPVVLFDVVVLDHAFNVTRRLLLGNVLVALGLAAVSYVVVRALVREHRRRDVDVVEYVLDA